MANTRTTRCPASAAEREGPADEDRLVVGVGVEGDERAGHSPMLAHRGPEARSREPVAGAAGWLLPFPGNRYTQGARARRKGARRWQQAV